MNCMPAGSLASGFMLFMGTKRRNVGSTISFDVAGSPTVAF